MGPTKTENAIREDLVRRFTKLVESFGLGASVKPVGSYVTGLYVPTSDIDMVIISRPRSNQITGSYYGLQPRPGLSTLLVHIRASGFASSTDAVLNAAVPVLHITDKITGLVIDLNDCEQHGTRATEAVQKWTKDDFDLIRGLVIILKTFLAIRRCGTTYTGGINSYVLVWMVVGWLNGTSNQVAYPRASTRRNPYLGDLLSSFDGLSISVDNNGASADTTNTVRQSDTSHPLEVRKYKSIGEALKGFLKFYGEDFDYTSKSIKFQESLSGQAPTKTVHIRSKYSAFGSQPFLLSLYDPVRQEDIGSKIYAIKHIQKTFRDGYQNLSRSDRAPSNSHGSVLNQFLQGDFTSFVKERKDVRRKVS